MVLGLLGWPRWRVDGESFEWQESEGALSGCEWNGIGEGDLSRDSGTRRNCLSRFLMICALGDKDVVGVTQRIDTMFCWMKPAHVD